MELADLARWTPVRLDFSGPAPTVDWAVGLFGGGPDGVEIIRRFESNLQTSLNFSASAWSLKLEEVCFPSKVYSTAV
jgi:hypothetical protein